VIAGKFGGYMKAIDIMLKQAQTLSPEMSVKEALDIFFKIKRTGLLVVDSSGKIAGTFTEKDILKQILPAYISNVGGFVYQDNPKGIKNKVADFVNLKVRDVMFKDVVTVDEGATISEVARIMITKNIRQLPVIDKSGKFLGVIGRHKVVSMLVESEA